MTSDWGDGGMKDLKAAWKASTTGWKAGKTIGGWLGATISKRTLEAEFDAETVEAILAEMRAGRNPEKLIEQARRAKAAREERERVLANPPPVHGSAHFATTAEMDAKKLLRDRSAFDDPSSILLGAFRDPETRQVRYIHWDGHGHLLTVAPTRSGKAQTVIIPNLLRYRGSAVVIDPKGELYRATSRWRRSLGPVYRIAPFDRRSDPDAAALPRHRFNPMARVESYSDAVTLAGDLYAPDPRAQEFFRNDFLTLMAPAMRFIQTRMTPENHNLKVLMSLVAGGTEKLQGFLKVMGNDDQEEIRDNAVSFLGKAGQSWSTINDTVRTVLGCFRDPDVSAVLSGDDFTFESLGTQTATVYIDIPFEKLKPAAPFLRLVVKCAIDAMLRVRTPPKIPTLFVLDEFLQLGNAEMLRSAMRTHAGAGVRLWYFVQDVVGLDEEYGREGHRAFDTCAIKQFFGVNDTYTATHISNALGTRTEAYRSINVGTNVSQGHGEHGPNMSRSANESVQLVGRPLKTPDEVEVLLADWVEKDCIRNQILFVGGLRILGTLARADLSVECRNRMAPS